MHESESEVTQSCPTPSDSMDCSLSGSSVHGIFQARVLEWGALLCSHNVKDLFSRGKKKRYSSRHMNLEFVCSIIQNLPEQWPNSTQQWSLEGSAELSFWRLCHVKIECYSPGHGIQSELMIMIWFYFPRKQAVRTGVELSLFIIILSNLFQGMCALYNCNTELWWFRDFNPR